MMATVKPQLQDNDGNGKSTATMAPKKPEPNHPSFVKRSLFGFILRMAGIVAIIWIIQRIFNG
jgi:hypothetical protein